jgi:(p)ppGpp synthase/HD superfamily hydrolase
MDFTRFILTIWIVSLGLSGFAAGPSAPNSCKAVSFGQIDSAKKQVRDFFEQPRNNPNFLHREAVEHSGEFAYILNRVAKHFDVEVIGPQIKSLESLHEKLMRKSSKGKMPKEIYDYLRGSIVFDSLGTLVDAFAFLNKKYPGEIGHIKNYFSEPKKSGYRAIHFSISLKDGYKAEIQFHLRDILETKKKLGDPIYAEYRKLELEKEELQEKVEALEQLTLSYHSILTNPMRDSMSFSHKGRDVSANTYLRFLRRKVAQLPQMDARLKDINYRMQRLNEEHQSLMETAWHRYLLSNKTEKILFEN